MLRIGLTGGIGSGKSAAGNVFAGLGAVVVDADRVAREVVEPGTPGLAALREQFGAGVLQPDGSLDRPALGALVFEDAAALARLNAIVHPLIGERTQQLVRAAERSGADLLVHDVPLLVENGLAPTYHLVAVVEASLEVRLARLAGRGLPEQQARSRIAAQADDAARQAVADVRLDNGGSREQLADQVRALHDGRLLPYGQNLAARRAAERGPVSLVAYDAGWPAAAARLAGRLRHLAGDRVVAVEHVGSTAVPGLAAKDIVDMQLAVRSWGDVEALARPLADGGFPRREDIDTDPVRPEVDPDPEQWRKRLHRSADPGRHANVHVRVDGTTSAGLVMRFRDVLRADGGLRAAYEADKRRLAALHPSDVEAYAEGKTPFVLAAVRPDRG